MAVQPKLPSGKGQKYDGQMSGDGGKEAFANPQRVYSPGLPTMDGLHDDIGEKSGFAGSTDHYIIKKGTPYGEAAKFNFLPPGMDINDQEMRDIRDMPFRQVVDMSYPEDGWSPAPRDLPEAYKAK